MVPSYQFNCQAREPIVFKQPEQECLPIARWTPTMSALAMTREPLSPHRQLDHVIGMVDAALENGVLEFEFEAAGGPDTALCREGAAKHGATIGQSSTFEAPRDQFGNRQHSVRS